MVGRSVHSFGTCFDSFNIGCPYYIKYFPIEEGIIWITFVLSFFQWSHTFHSHIDNDKREKEIISRLDRFKQVKTRIKIINDLIRMTDEVENFEYVLDIGCGNGTFVTEIADKTEKVIGIDISLEELILAKKKIEEVGFKNIILAAACAEKLPFPNDKFSFGHFVDVIEHVRSPDIVVNESIRVIDNNGFLSFNSPNRFDLLKPEPHVGLRFVGFWPRFMQPIYVKIFTGKEYKAKKLLSLNEVRDIMENCANNLHNYLIVYWYLLDPNSEGSSKLGSIIRKFPFLVFFINKIWGDFTSQHQIIAWKNNNILDKTKREQIIATRYGI